MSKSKGNVVTPMHLLEEYGSDAVRYWAASARPGTDTAFDTNQMKVGRRLGIKLLNATKFVLGFPAPAEGAQPTERVDLALLARLNQVVHDSTAAFDSYDYAKALDRTETAFWSFCDDYVELVKQRAYGNQGDEAAASANATLRIALSTFHRLLAPFLPFVADEVWSWWQSGSVHRSQWPSETEFPVGDQTDEVLVAAGNVLAEVRRAKSDAKVSQRAEVARAVVSGNEATLAMLRFAEADLKDAGSITDLVFKSGESAVSVDLTAQA